LVVADGVELTRSAYGLSDLQRRGGRADRPDRRRWDVAETLHESMQLPPPWKIAVTPYFCRRRKISSPKSLPGRE